MAKILDGKAVSQRIKDELKIEVEGIKAKGVNPGLAVVIVGDNPASRVYVNSKKKACAEIGIASFEYALEESTTEEELLALVRKLNVEWYTCSASSSKAHKRRNNYKRYHT